MDDLRHTIDRLASETAFSGAVRIDRDGEPWLAQAYGLADRRHAIANTLDTRFALASGMKGLTALAVIGLVADGVLELDGRARPILGADLPAIDDRVTIEQLLAHRSGIGDYLDEHAGGNITDHVLPVPVHRLATTEDYLVVLDGFPMKFAPGTSFSYCNGGFVVLALLAERASGVPFHELVRTRVCVPAGLTATGVLRSDELPGDAATGYLDAGSPRTNVHHLPVLGTGDGGVYSTLADVHALWTAFFAGRIVPSGWVAEMVRPYGDGDEHGDRYGLGFWLHPSNDAARLEGYDAGVSFRTSHRPSTGITATVASNTSDGAWPLARAIADALDV